jgi:hypothetical protein
VTIIWNKEKREITIIITLAVLGREETGKKFIAVSLLRTNLVINW